MTGTRADAEDIVQEAYLRWHRTDAGEVRSPEAWLVSVVTRLAIDRLRKASVEREAYTGQWLPEPLFGVPSPEEQLELASDLSMAFMVLLERLAPSERAAFLLHDIFDCDYPTSRAYSERARRPADRLFIARGSACGATRGGSVPVRKTDAG
jgi:RNA polymerase sigma-70 factor (ECF subfamily)